MSSLLTIVRRAFVVLSVVAVSVTTSAAFASESDDGPGHSDAAHEQHGGKPVTDSEEGPEAHAQDFGDTNTPQPASNADFSGHGANTHGPYDSTRDGSPSQNGSGNGEAVGKPCAGCVGHADNKNPAGQMPGGSDPNAGYECDRNHGVGRSNPAHTGCTDVGSTEPEPGSEGTAPESDDDEGAEEKSISILPEEEAVTPSTEVTGLGATDGQPGAALTPETEVLGIFEVRTPAALVASLPVREVAALAAKVPVRAQTLPVTGMDIAALVLLAVGLLAGGAVTTRIVGRKTDLI